jgi:hypothetical protein
MVAVPTAMPDTAPDREPMLATDGLLLLHRPPPMQLVKVVAPPAHTLVSVSGQGDVVTVMPAVAVHPTGEV